MTETMTIQMSYKCAKCKDEGFIYYEKEDEYGNIRQYAKPCECRIKENNEKRIAKANVSELFKKCTFYNFKEHTLEQEKVKKKCVDFYRQLVNCDVEVKVKWLLLSGQVGSGKTHLAISILNNLIKNGINVLYTNYKDLIRELSQSAMDKLEYDQHINKCVNADVLLIDDLFKSRNNAEITKATLEYMYQIINKRYLNNAITIFTSEKSVNELLEIDEAIGSRIVQMTNKEFIVNMEKIKNYRLL